MNDTGGGADTMLALKPYLPPIAAAVLGRLVYHAREVQAKRRPALSVELLWELPIAVAMGFVVFGTLKGVAAWWPSYALPVEGMLATAIVCSYLGPRLFDIALVGVLTKFGLVGAKNGA